MKYLFIFLIPISLQAATTMSDVVTSYKKASYLETLDLVNKLPKKEFTKADPYYMRGLAYYSLQKYKVANLNFRRAIGFKEHPVDTHYFYAQSLLAIGESEKAKEQFKSSFRSNYRQQYSKYYTHYIEKEQQHTHKALEGFGQIFANEKFDRDVRQPAQYEYSKILLKNLNEASDKKEALKVYDELKLAYNLDPNSQIAKDIEKDYFRIDSEYKLGKEVFANGMRKPKKNIYLNFSEYFYYDSNVATLSDNVANSQPTDVDSYVSSSKLTASYRHYWSQSLTTQPILGLDYLKHTNTDSSLVHSNDSLVYSIDINNSYKHQFLDKPSSLLFEFGYDNTQKDRNGAKELENYGSNSYFSIGESLKFFDIGFSTIKYKFNNFAAFSDALNNVSHTFTAIQYWNRPNKHRVVFSSFLSMTDSETDTSDTNVLGVSTNYTIPDLYKKTDITMGMKVSATDPIEQRETRGLETLLSPSVELMRNFRKLVGNTDVFVSGKYAYKLNSSEDEENYGYSKHELGLKAKVQF